MKKMLVLLIAVFIVAFTIAPCFAYATSDLVTYNLYDGTTLTASPVPVTDAKPYVVFGWTTGKKWLRITAEPLTLNDSGNITASANATGTYVLNDDGVTWDKVSMGTMTYGFKPYWSNYDIYDANGTLVYSAGTTTSGNATNTPSRPDYPADWNVENYPYAFMLHDASTGSYYFYGYGKTMTANTDGSIFLRGPTFGIKYTYNATHPSGNPWADYVTLEVDAFDVVTFQNTLTLVWSNYDILYEDGTNFFPVTPTVPSQMSGVITEAMMVQVIAEILTILPIGLACGITYLALRKGLAMLRELLLMA